MSQAMNKLVKRAKADSAFLYELLANPARVTEEFDLNESEREALTGNSAGRLATLVDVSVLAAGCGSSQTCPSTCTATCTVTFTSVAEEAPVAAG